MSRGRKPGRLRRAETPAKQNGGGEPASGKGSTRKPHRKGQAHAPASAGPSPAPPGPRTPVTLYPVTARDLGEHGEGIASLEDGLTCFVPGLLPGENGRVSIAIKKRNYAVGRLEERLTDAPGRRPAPCAHFPDCGGCQVQHLEESGQREWKRRQLGEALSRIGGFQVDVPPVLASEASLGWRNKLSFPIRWGEGRALVGFYRQGSHHVVDIAACPVGAMPQEAILAAVKRWIARERISVYDEATREGLLRHLVLRSTRDGAKILAVLVASKQDPILGTLRDVLMPPGGGALVHGLFLNLQPSQGNAIFGEELIHLAGDRDLSEELGGLRFHLSPLAFFQMNPPQAERLYETALSHLLPETPSLVDLYCGTGTLTLLAAKRLGPGAKITGIEAHAGAIADARRNAGENELGHVAFIEADAAEGFDTLCREGNAPHTVLLDPPRGGADASVLESIGASAVKRVVYVSCKPSTLARDLKILGAVGFNLRAVQAVDLFPQTTHIETVALMDRE